MAYVELLASLGGVGSINAQVPPAFPGVVSGATGRYVVLCPFAVTEQMAIPVKVWRAVARHMRLYDLSVLVMGNRGEWLEGAAFLESEILSELSIQMKLEFLHSAELVVGAPNEWTWCAAAWQRKSVILYPQYTPQSRWFPFSGIDTYGRLVYDPHQLQIPVVLAGLRGLIESL